MPHVFVSHAGADSGFVDKFVERILTLGLHLTNNQIFYSSDRGKGVPSGQSLLAYVRGKVSDADLVIAVVSPMFQTRPVCVAELGAAWSRAGEGKFFPVAVPGMARTDMEGVLEGVLVLHLDDEELLDELAKAVCQALDIELDPGDWTKYKAIWLAEVTGLLDSVATPEVVTREEYDAVEGRVEGLKEALVESANETQALKRQIERYKVAGDEEERRAALLPEDEKARFEVLCSTAARALGELDSIVQDVIFHEIAEGPMPWPNAYDDRARNEAAQAAVSKGDLKVTWDDEHLVADESVRDVKRAWEAVRELRAALEEGDFSEAFHEWFVDEYGAPAELARQRIWEQLFG